MKQVLPHASLRCLTVVMLAALWLLPAGAWATSAGGVKVMTEPAGCRDGRRRVGTFHDPTLGRTWAVVASCRHPSWPAHLEPAGRWKALPPWVPAGRRVVVSSREAGTAMRLEGRTVTPGRVGQTVTVRLADGARVRGRLTAPGRAEMTTEMRWRQP